MINNFHPSITNCSFILAIDFIVVVLTKLLLLPVAVQIDPQLAVAVVLDTRVALVVQAVERAAHHAVDLRVGARG